MISIEIAWWITVNGWKTKPSHTQHTYGYLLHFILALMTKSYSYCLSHRIENVYGWIEPCQVKCVTCIFDATWDQERMHVLPKSHIHFDTGLRFGWRVAQKTENCTVLLKRQYSTTSITASKPKLGLVYAFNSKNNERSRIYIFIGKPMEVELIGWQPFIFHSFICCCWCQHTSRAAINRRRHLNIRRPHEIVMQHVHGLDNRIQHCPDNNRGFIPWTYCYYMSIYDLIWFCNPSSVKVCMSQNVWNVLNIS